MTAAKTCDLHTHTLFSDGVLTPRQLVRAAREAGLDAIAVTDHDVTGGIDEAREEGEKAGLEVVPGVELSSHIVNAKGVETEVHILGYLLRHTDPQLQETLSLFRQQRDRRADQMLERLAEKGVKLTKQQVQEQVDGDAAEKKKSSAHVTSDQKAVGRPHVARALLKAGYVKSVEEAFEKYLKQGRPGFVPRVMMSPEDCIQLIHRAGGLAVVAHPRFGGPKNRKGWDALVQAGLDGIEAQHSQQTAQQVKQYRHLAGELGLLATGGSDYHSDDNPRSRLGSVRLPYAALEALRERKKLMDQKSRGILQ